MSYLRKKTPLISGATRDPQEEVLQRFFPIMTEYFDNYKGKESLTSILGLHPENPMDIPKISTFIRSICTIAAPSEQEGQVICGTGFLAFVPVIDSICFFSAGHCLGRVLTAKRKDTLKELEKTIITFGNFDGKLHCEASSELGILEPMSLRSFLERFGLSYYGSASESGTLKVFKKGRGPQEPQSTSASDDYCAIVLNGSCLEGVKTVIDVLGLSYLECGCGDYLDYKRGGIVQMIGHPSVDTSDENPMRISPGREKSIVGDKLYVDYDSLGGHSGSPVIGMGHKSTEPGMDQAYKVKAIHIMGKAIRGHSLAMNNNCSISIRNVQHWINRGK